MTAREGFSLGDRLCIALAREHGPRVVTMDRAWLAIDLGVEVDCPR
ncbi:MAG TPA: hypothetical protein VGS12_10345 [Caulobacteraceae bacterium]|nr:hypothetical protein [Caulobacteraceae bacterium]